MLYHSRYTEDAEVYFQQLSCALEGELDAPAFALAWQQVLDRHTALRTSFHWRELERPLQVVHRRVAVPFVVEDWRDLVAEEQEERLAALLAADRRRGFDFARPPLLRLTLCRLADSHYRLVWSFHHLLFDGWSMPLVIQEVFALYAANARGEALQLPPARPYRDFILWLKRQDMAAAEAFWRQSLAGFGAPTPLVLGAGRAGAAGEGEETGVAHAFLTLEGSFYAALQELARRHSLTLSTVIQGAWALLLARSSGEADVVFGLTTAGRPADLPGSATMIGLFINTLPVRLRVDPGEPLLPWLRALQSHELRLREHEHSPLVRIQGWSDVPRGVPLFENLVVFEGFAVENTLAREEMKLAVGEVKLVQKTNFPLTLNASPDGLRVRLRLNYERSRFSAADAARALGHLEILLRAMVEKPERCLGDLALTTAAERHQIAVEWNDPQAPAAAEANLFSRFVAQAALTPEAVALVSASDGPRLTYGELARRAQRVGRRLRERGVGPGARVGLSLDRSPELVVGLLGILAAGGAYVPIDPAYPAERQALMLEDSQPTVVVTTEWLALEPPHGTLAPALSAAETGDPVYVIYTSGSTGRPKGAVVRQGAFLNLVDWYVEALEMNATDRLLLLSSASFDLTQKNFFAPLLVGGELHLAPAGYDPAGLRAIIEVQGITRVNCTPSAFYPLAEEGDAAVLASLRSVVLGGEPIATGRLERWRRHGDCRAVVINSYGPTECTDVVACHRVASADEPGEPGVPLGRPIPGVRLWIGGDGPDPVPIGFAGELWVGGDCVGGGYLGDPARTAERFVPDASGPAGGRAYRTGDLARRLPGGEIDYLGRIDHQVKVRGFRIELEEIEAALATHPAVREAAVVVRGETLTAYVVSRPAAEPPAAGELHAFLCARLPEPMIPALFVPLAALPLTPSGKVDRRSLPDPAARQTARGTAPRGELEVHLAGLFRDVLKLPADAGLSADGDFFALGGHSIAAAVLINRLQDKLGAILYAVALFDAPTVSRLAAYLVANYPEAVARVFGEAALGGAAARLAPGTSARIDHAAIAALRRAIVPLPPVRRAARRNPPAVFVLSPPRSGSTLLRVMLAGHPRLFAPPELELLSFHTLAERRASFPGRNAFWLEGTVRAAMEVRGVSAEDAEALLAGYEREGMTTQELYRRLQEWIGDRTLVDKSPSYALDRRVLASAEETFDGARYIHLLRHPYGMIHSFEEAKLEQVFFRHPHGFSRRDLAELIWLVSQENILGFLAALPRERQLTVRFEDLLARPQAVLEKICAFLELDFHPAMALPYQERGERGAGTGGTTGRMTDGIHAWSRMLGDVKFLTHRKVDPAVAERWRSGLTGLVLGDATVALAERLGYTIEALDRPAEAERWAETARTAIARRPAESGPLPLSYSQERLWFIDQLQPGSVAYNLPVAVRLTGDLLPAAFHAALNEVVRRHESLRTTFGFVPGESSPVQRVAPVTDLALPRLDLRALGGERREAELRRLVTAEARRPFDLAAGPLFRAALAVLGPAEHVAVLDLHHIVADGHSMGVLIREIAALYAAFAAGRPSPLPGLPVQYPDYALWQRTWLAGEVLAAQTAYWRTTLEGTPVLELPTDLPRPPVRTERGGLVRRLLPASLAAGLGTLAEREKATRFMVLLAAWWAVLARTAGQVDFAVGVPVANRTRPEIEGLIGFFVNTLVLRLNAGGAADFQTLVARARQSALGAYAHQDLPFEKVVEAVQPPRDTSRSPLFQVMLAFQNVGNASEDGLALPGLRLEPLSIDGGSVKFDLSLSVQEGGTAHFALRAGYRADLFFATTVTRHLGHLEALLAAALAEPGRPLAELPLLHAAERQQLLSEWNDTAAPAAGGVDLYGLFAASAAARPDAPAVAGPWERGQAPAVLSYGELGRRVEALASRLAALGVGPEIRVGVCLPRSPEAVMAILAVLAAGGAFVPLDPSHPAERRAFQLADAGATLLLPGFELLAAAAFGSPPGRVDSLDRLAYVLYTSGSTGTPSGVLMSHRSAVNLVADARRRLAITPQSRVLQAAPLSFDVSVAELFVPLASGAALCIVGDETRRDPVLLAAALTDLAVDRAFVTPAFFTALPAGTAPGLHASVGGEAFSRELALLWGPGRRLFNNYGPTEAAVYATSRFVEPAGGDPSIGGPIPNVRAVLLDAGLQPVPLGVAGEICLAGEALARGYAGRPEKTAERFVPDPYAHAGRPGERLYRTGDLGRRRATGEIEFLGRIDDQVKVRGFRIEPAEIEAALLAHPAVRQAAVVARGTASERRLVAYAGAPGELPEPSELRRFLASRLPEPMVPGVVIVLPALPVTAHGKVDRRNLPAELIPPLAATRVAPESAVERLLAALWEEVLGRTGIGADEDFFALGGSSLQAAILIKLLERRLGEYVYVVALFDAPTIAGLAGYLERHYPEAVARATGVAAVEPGSEAMSGRVDEAEVARFLALVEPLAPRAPERMPARRARRAVFVLSPPRSGSTLLRVLLGGHPGLFAPPELELLGFNTLGERRAAFSGRYAFWAEGLVRAVMELDGVSAEEATAAIAAYEDRDATVRELYADLEGRLGGRLLVDKTPSYALDPAVLARIEEDFEEPRYVHLVRHPHGMIRSFVQAKLDQVFFRSAHDYPRRELAELIWLSSQRHILTHLANVPAQRHIQVRFEDLVGAPEIEMRRVAAFLRIDFDPAMLEPYAEGGRRMTDGVHALSKMLGDVKFHQHQGVDATVAEAWQAELREDFLGDVTWAQAEALGYRREDVRRRTAKGPGRSLLVPLALPAGSGPGRPLFLIHPAGGDVSCYRELARALQPELPVYGLIAPRLTAGEPFPTIEARAALYVEAIVAAQPAGPYRVGGWSFGGVVAWEVAQQLHRRGAQIDLVVLLDSHVPDPAERTSDPAEALARLAADLVTSDGQPLGITAEALRAIAEPERVETVFTAARRHGALPEGLDLEQARAFLRAGEADVDALFAYRPEPYPGRVLLVRAARQGWADASLGWGELATAGLEIVRFAVPHRGLLADPVTAEVAELLKGRLDS